VCRYSWHSAGSPGWPFPVLKYKCIAFQIKYTEAILSNSTRKLLRLEISKMVLQFKRNTFIVLFTIIFGTLSYPVVQRDTASLYVWPIATSRRPLDTESLGCADQMTLPQRRAVNSRTCSSICLTPRYCEAEEQVAS